MAEGMHQLGKYRIVEELGAGGFATVFKALDTTLDREVALKILHPPLLADRRFVQNFRQEAKTLAALRHPQIITIYEVGEIDGRIFIAMELARGTSLARAIASRHRIPWGETLALLEPVCEALDYAHEQNVVHRDLKPANILIDKQRGALLTDFGFAKLLAENAASMAMSGGIVGTPGYIAQEVWENNAADAPVDIYALGCIAYEMLTGDVLFKGQTPIQAMRAHDRGPQFPETWPEDTPAGIASILRTALAREPTERYATAGALWHALNDLQAQAPRVTAEQTEAARREAEREAAQLSPMRQTSQRGTGFVHLLLVPIALVVIGIVILLGSKISMVSSTIDSEATPPAAATELSLNIKTPGEELQFEPASLSATADQQVTVNFENGSATQKHNWVLVNGGDDVAQQIDEAAAAAGEDNGYIPDGPNIVAHTNLLDAGATDSASFTLPAGTYTFLCTFPDHYSAGMKGTLSVE